MRIRSGRLLDPDPGELGEWPQQLVDKAQAASTNLEAL
jgi:hypothetical protein